jgi:hypothetical protein
MNNPLEVLKHHVSGAIERGEAVAITAQDSLPVEFDGKALLLKALRAIADCGESDLAKYCAKVDDIAVSALVAYACGKVVQS